MGNLIRSLFEPSELTPHGFCLLWEPGLIWLHSISDVLIALSYFSIPLAMMAFLRRRRDVEFGWVVLALRRLHPVLRDDARLLRPDAVAALLLAGGRS
jgi:uncharacterized membrane protein